MENSKTIKKKNKRWNVVTFIYLFYYYLSRVVLKIWVSKRVVLFCRQSFNWRDVFLTCCPQVLSCLNLGCRGIFETHNNPIQEREFYGEYFDVIDYIPKTFVGEPIGYW